MSDTVDNVNAPRTKRKRQKSKKQKNVKKNSESSSPDTKKYQGANSCVYDSVDTPVCEQGLSDSFTMPLTTCSTSSVQSGVNCTVIDDITDDTEWRGMLLTVLTSVQCELKNVSTEVANINIKLDSLDSKLQRVDARLDGHTSDIQDISNDIGDLKQTRTENEVKLNEINALLKATEQKLIKLEQINANFERSSKRNNMRLVGLAETQDEDCRHTVQVILENKFQMANAEVESAYRVGRRQSGDDQKPRHIVFRLQKYQDKIKLFKEKRQKMRGLDYFLTDDLTNGDYQKKKCLQPIINCAKNENKRCIFRHGQLYIAGVKYMGPIPDRDDAEWVHS